MSVSPTFVFHELTIIIVIPERFEDRLIRMNVMVTKERLQVLGSFWSMVCHMGNLLADFSMQLVETHRTASWERTVGTSKYARL